VLGLERPPRWGIVTVVLLVTANAALLAYLTLRPLPVDPRAGAPAPTVATSDAAAESSTPAQSAVQSDPAGSEERPVLAVYGDGYSAGSSMGGQADRGWPAVVAAELQADLRLNAISMVGYAALGRSGQDFSDLVLASPEAGATATVVFGSRNDLGQPAAVVGQQAVETYALIRSAAPQTRLVVVGPSWSSADVPAELLALRDAIRSAAMDARAVFIDPIAEGWFADPAGLIADDGISPTDAGHAFIGTQVAPVLQQVLDDA
jgi:lysophospholipase L1-like esterase